MREPVAAKVEAEGREYFIDKKLLEVRRRLKLLSHSWPIAFHIEALLRNGLVNTDQLLNILWKPITDLSKNNDLCCDVLKQFILILPSKPPTQGLLSFFNEFCKRKLAGQVQRTPLPANIMKCWHVTITPTRMILQGPYIVQSNRVTRLFPEHHDHFLRVDFRDEDKLQFRWVPEVDGEEFLQFRVGGTLRDGFVLGGRRFEFLGYSTSALREHAVWFVNPFQRNGETVDASTIRRLLGNFSNVLSCPPKFAARLAQAFTATDPSVTISREQITEMPDMGPKNYEFTDGESPSDDCRYAS